jgi:hypothetical protein
MAKRSDFLGSCLSATLGSFALPLLPTTSKIGGSNCSFSKFLFNRTELMTRKIGFWLLWLGFVSYAFLLAPPNQPDTFDLIKRLSTGDWQGINPLIIALFNIMGVWPIIYSAVLFIDGRMQKLPAWLFASASFGVGAFALIPYLALREPNGSFRGKKNVFLKVLDSRWLGLSVLIGTIVLVAFGVTQGDWSDFAQQWRSDRFIHVMSLDFCMLCLLFPALLGNDMERRGVKNDRFFWAVSLVPLLGAATYLVLRPAIADQPESDDVSSEKTAASAGVEL